MPRHSINYAQNFPAEVLSLARDIRIVFLDVDGVLTSGQLIYDAEGENQKVFNTLDGHGLKLIQRAGIIPAIISGRDGQPLRRRLAQLGITHMALGTEDKLPAAAHILAALNLDWSAAAAMGDDWPDLPLMQRARLAIAPPGAHAENRARADWITQAAAGSGAVRELCDLLLIAGGHYQKMLEHYLPAQN